jgi:hypothetical protein
MNNYLAFIILAINLGLIATGAAQEFSYAFPQEQGPEIVSANSNLTPHANPILIHS